jgi:hypothetical protein
MAVRGVAPADELLRAVADILALGLLRMMGATFAKSIKF